MKPRYLLIALTNNTYNAFQFGDIEQLPKWLQQLEKVHPAGNFWLVDFDDRDVTSIK